jgi:hypothetical protein
MGPRIRNIDASSHWKIISIDEVILNNIRIVTRPVALSRTIARAKPCVVRDINGSVQ